MEACGPNLARTNARVEKGFNLGAAGVYNRTSRDTQNEEHQNLGQADFNIGYSDSKESNLGFSALGKIGINSYPGIDLYLELPSRYPFYYGIGAELGAGNGGYIIGSYYFTEVFFISFTGRVSRWIHQQALYSPQLSLGWSYKKGSPTVSLFSGYQYFSGRGLNMDTNFIGEGSPSAGDVNRLVYGGVSFQF